MGTMRMYILECAESHSENGDRRGAMAIMFAAMNGAVLASRKYPEEIPAIENAIKYAKQEIGK